MIQVYFEKLNFESLSESKAYTVNIFIDAIYLFTSLSFISANKFNRWSRWSFGFMDGYVKLVNTII